MWKDRISVVLVGPSADKISGSLLRPLNIWYSLRGILSIHLVYVAVNSFTRFIELIPKILSADIVIVSGVNPWISAIVAVMRMLIRKATVVDFHGSAWYEASAMGSHGTIFKTFLFVSECFAYRFSSYITAASTLLAKILNIYLGERSVYIIPNALTSTFTRVADTLSEYSKDELLRVLGEELRKILVGKKVLLAPLPDVFKANVLAAQQLESLSEALSDDYLIVITGTSRFVKDRVVGVGHLPFVKYVALLLASDAVVLPYPANAVCGGARNKVLEAAYCKKTLITTRAGMMGLITVPNIHYIPFENCISSSPFDHCLEQVMKKCWMNRALRLHELVLSQHSFEKFKLHLLKLILHIIKRKLVRLGW